MYRKFIELLGLITDELLNDEMDLDDAMMRITDRDINLFHVNDELKMLEKSDLIGEEEADAVRSVLIYLFAEKTDIELEEIYALVFGRGKKITWH
ncbi:hypothetical protein BMS3Bbin06_01664 [bacterium BMS3Bbin06]|nr:hypothetical protein BMS3Abin08_01584 [bacterium BMS3Abin08]GBE33898.1 hypothetical protein BMS3Bbin06_00413 [bacterium BMS3Bbin06]GBE35127.1 hypothetical protein BMS3Bbin06_01664 [bacterium BMS3Bbin06]HDO35508.1 hypothetical protein [Nitrospirota bacterium]HDO35566.1 hypothetical protein [Nitrospirota bacterium]